MIMKLHFLSFSFTACSFGDSHFFKSISIFNEVNYFCGKTLDIFANIVLISDADFIFFHGNVQLFQLQIVAFSETLERGILTKFFN